MVSHRGCPSHLPGPGRESSRRRRALRARKGELLEDEGPPRANPSALTLPTPRHLSSGQKSSRRSRTGAVTIMDFAISPKRKNRATGRYRRTEGDSEYQAYARNMSIRKNVLSTSFRSETQATDSTCSGCSANRAGHQRAPPQGPRHPEERQEQDHGAPRVQQHARQVVPPGPQPVEVAVQHVRQPRERVVEPEVQGRERPPRVLPRHPRLHPQVRCHVDRVVVVDEAGQKQAGEDEDCPESQGHAQEEDQAPRERAGPPACS